MSVRFRIGDGDGTNNSAKVTTIGQLVTAPFAYDETVFKELAEINTAYNFYEPKDNQQFVITGFVVKADRGVSPTVDADVIIYEADDSDGTTVDKTLFQLAMVQGDQVVFNPNIIVNKGKYVNAKTTDDDVYLTITGYYIPKLS